MTPIDWSNLKREMADSLFYTNNADKDTIINNDEKFQLISVKTTNSPYLAYSCSNQFGS